LIAAALPGPLRDLLDAPEFRDGLEGGLIAAAILGIPGLLAGRAFRPDRGTAVAWAGLAPAVVLVVALERLDGFARPGEDVSGLEWALAALVAGGILAGLVRGRWFGVLCAVPGAAILCGPGLSGADDTDRLLGFVAIVVVAPLLGELDRTVSVPGLAPLLVLVALGGQYAALPDTEKPALLVGAALPVGLVGWPLGLARLGTAGAFAVTGAAVWSAEVNGAARPGSIVGAFGTFTFLALAPLVWRRARRGRGDRSGRRPRRERAAAHPALGARPGRAARREALESPWARGLAALVAQGVVVVWASRVAGLREGRAAAAVLLLPAAVVAVWVAARLPELGPAGRPAGPGPGPTSDRGAMQRRAGAGRRPMERLPHRRFRWYVGPPRRSAPPPLATVRAETRALGPHLSRGSPSLSAAPRAISLPSFARWVTQATLPRGR
jgi:hypothetical protein